MRIPHPVSFFLAVGLMIVTALLAVALHGFLFIVAVADITLIGLLPWIAHREARKEKVDG